MPNNVPNYPLLPSVLLIPNAKKVDKCVTTAKSKIQTVCKSIKNGVIKKRGFNVFSKILGIPQGVTALSFEKKASQVVTITGDCNLCGLCVSICPMKNLRLENENIVHNKNCTICYRCINKCPQKAITILFNKKVTTQYKGLNSAK
jgi:ferredoxin